MANETRSNKTVDELSEELKIIELQRKISEAKKKKAEADKALEPISEIEKAKQLAEQEKAIAEAKKGTLKAILPDSEVKALEGKHTIDDNVAIECKILTYKAMSEIAFQIGKEIKNIRENIRIERVIICNQDDFNTVLLYKIFIKQVQLLKKQYEEAITEAIKPIPITMERITPFMLDFVTPMAAMAAVPAVLKSFVDIASLFRTDTDIKGKETEIVDEAVVAEIARALNSVGIITIYPIFINKIPDKVLGDLSELPGLKREADKKIEEWGANEKFMDKVAFLKNLNIQYEKILTGLVGVDEETGINRLETLIKGKILSTELDKDNTDVLYLKVVDGGGNNKVTRNLLHSRLSHSGGAIITYFLLSKEGIIKTSKTLYNITGYKEFKNSGSIEKLNNFELKKSIISKDV